MRHIKPHPSKEELEDIFIYDDGNLYWKNPTKRHKNVDSPIGRIGTKGYLSCDIKNSTFLIHRLIWILHNGSIPNGLVVNHKNEIKTDNRIGNLELVTPRYNVSYSSKNKTGHIGVVKSNEKWKAQIKLNDGSYCYLGVYETIEEASEVYQQKKNEIDG